MKKELLTEALGMLDDDLIENALIPPKKRRKKISVRFITAAAIIACLAVPVPAACAFGSDTAYHLLYFLAPSVAQSFKPVQMSCTDNGIEMKVESCSVEESEASFFISLRDVNQQNRIGNHADLYDSYDINLPYDMTGHCSFSEYDPETGTAYFLVHLETMNNQKIQPGKITFFVREIIGSKKIYNDEFNLDSSLVLSNPETLKLNREIYKGGWKEPENNFNPEEADRDYYEKIDQEVLENNFLKPLYNPLFKPVNGISLSAAGFVDGKLHLQIHQENILDTHNHGTIEFMLHKETGGKVESEMEALWCDEENTGSYRECVFDIPEDELSNYKPHAYFVSGSELIKGNWSVTFKMK